MSLKNAAQLAHEEQDKPDVNLQKDWSPDYFPTSARKVFIGWGVMIGGIVILCTAVYFSSEHPADTVKDSQVTTAKSRMTEMNQLDEDSDE